MINNLTKTKINKRYWITVAGMFIVVGAFSVRNCPPNVIALKLLVLPAFVAAISTFPAIEKTAKADYSSNKLISYSVLESILFAGVMVLALWSPSMSVIAIFGIFVGGSLLKGLIRYANAGSVFS